MPPWWAERGAWCNGWGTTCTRNRNSDRKKNRIKNPVLLISYSFFHRTARYVKTRPSIVLSTPCLPPSPMSTTGNASTRRYAGQNECNPTVFVPRPCVHSYPSESSQRPSILVYVSATTACNTPSRRHVWVPRRQRQDIETRPAKFFTKKLWRSHHV